MPLYEYECEAGHRFEEIQKFSDDPLEQCHCGAIAKRVLCASSFSLKGDGWYRDGYTKKQNKKELAERTRQAHIKRDFDS